jgi:formylglycine-generating enzyme required for sulfatase activity
MKNTFLIGFIILCVVSVSTYGVPPDMVLVPSGEFEMGDFFNEGYWGWDELPVHSVKLDSFYIGRYEVTNQQYCAFLNWADDNGWVTVTDGVVYKAASGTSYPYCHTSTSSSYSQIAYTDGVFGVRSKGGRDMSNDPMVEVSWYGAVAYCNWRSEEEGYERCYDLSTWECDFTKDGYRLPTEGEWEYTARGGLAGKRYPWGDTIEANQANYLDSGDPYECGAWPYTTPVGFYNGQLHHQSDFSWPCPQDTYQTMDGSNGFALYDMAGNVFEWCNDWFDPYFYRITPYPHINPVGPSSGTIRVLRGGDWAEPAGPPEGCRVANRIALDPSQRGHNIGFRVASVSEPPLQATVDIDPDTLNLKSKGKWITCYIELPEGYDVADIDISTIMLNGQVPAESRPTGILDYDGDGIAELMVKFSRSSVQALLTPGETTELTVTGELVDGTKFEGTETIRVIDPGKKK